MHSAAAAIMGAAQCVDLLYNAEVNHRYLDQQVDTADTPAFSPNAKPAFVPPHVPSAARVDRAVPEGRDASGLDVPEQLWPNGDLEKLRIAADAWHAAAGELRTAAALANGPIRSVRRQRSPELRLAVTYCGQVQGHGVRGRRVILRLDGLGGQCRGGGLLFCRGVVGGA